MKNEHGYDGVQRRAKYLRWKRKNNSAKMTRDEHRELDSLEASIAGADGGARTRLREMSQTEVRHTDDATLLDLVARAGLLRGSVRMTRVELERVIREFVDSTGGSSLG